jgi:hypothetical protein
MGTPTKSRGGQVATVLCIDKPKGHPVIAYLEDGSVVLCDAYGRMNPDLGASLFDLIQGEL